jgi:superfamily II helicase
VAITDRIYVKNHRQLGSQLDRHIPRGAFSGATLDILFSGDGLSKLDDANQERALAFAEDFLDCDCETNPYCGHPERKFVRYLLDLRAQGFGPDAIVDVMGADYGLYAYSGDVLSFLDSSVRTLDAISQLARVDGHEDVSTEATNRTRDLLG